MIETEAKMRRVYFSFDYEHDLDRVNKVRTVPGVIACSAAGFHNSDVWYTASGQGDAAVQGLINDALNNTTVTVVCLGHMTAHRKFLTFELEQSLERGNGVVGVKINHITNEARETEEEGYVPPLIKMAGYNVHKYNDQQQLALWIEDVADLATEQSQQSRQRQALHHEGDR